MGCDIHSYAERRDANEWECIDAITPFSHRSYSVFGFLAGVRNYSAITPIAMPRGLPMDVSRVVATVYEVYAYVGDAHTASWLLISELTKFNYDALCEDRQVMINRDGSQTCAPGGGKVMSYRKFLGPHFFADLSAAQVAGTERIVFWFDN